MEEALRAARDGLSQAGEVLQFSQALWGIGHGEEATSFVRQGQQRTYDDGLAGWLADRHEERGEVSTALDLQLRRIELRPALERYLKVKGLAEALGRGRRYALVSSPFWSRRRTTGCWSRYTCRRGKLTGPLKR